MKKYLIAALTVIIVGLAAYVSRSYWMPIVVPSQEISVDTGILQNDILTGTEGKFTIYDCSELPYIQEGIASGEITCGDTVLKYILKPSFNTTKQDSTPPYFTTYNYTLELYDGEGAYLRGNIPHMYNCVSDFCPTDIKIAKSDSDMFVVRERGGGDLCYSEREESWYNDVTSLTVQQFGESQLRIYGNRIGNISMKPDVIGPNQDGGYSIVGVYINNDHIIYDKPKEYTNDCNSKPAGLFTYTIDRTRNIVEVKDLHHNYLFDINGGELLDDGGEKKLHPLIIKTYKPIFDLEFTKPANFKHFRIIEIIGEDDYGNTIITLYALNKKTEKIDKLVKLTKGIDDYEIREDEIVVGRSFGGGDSRFYNEKTDTIEVHANTNDYGA